MAKGNPTRATLKSFINKNRKGKLFVKVDSSFSGMSDMVEFNDKATFQSAQPTEMSFENTYGILGVWVVGGGRDYIRPYETESYKGFTVSNCCGSFVIVAEKEVEDPLPAKAA